MQTKEQLFQRVYEETYDRCFYFVLKKAKQLEDVADIVQTIYIALYEVIDRKGVDYIDNYEAYVMTIAKSKIAAQYSWYERAKQWIPLTRTEDGRERHTIDDMIDPFDDAPAAYTVSTQLLDDIASYVRTKPPIVQKAFYLFYGEDLSIQQVAERLDLPLSTAKTYIYRTAHDIRDQFREDERHE